MYIITHTQTHTHTHTHTHKHTDADTHARAQKPPARIRKCNRLCDADPEKMPCLIRNRLQKGANCLEHAMLGGAGTPRKAILH